MDMKSEIGDNISLKGSKKDKRMQGKKRTFPQKFFLLHLQSIIHLFLKFIVCEVCCYDGGELDDEQLSVAV